MGCHLLRKQSGSGSRARKRQTPFATEFADSLLGVYSTWHALKQLFLAGWLEQAKWRRVLHDPIIFTEPFPQESGTGRIKESHRTETTCCRSSGISRDR